MTQIEESVENVNLRNNTVQEVALHKIEIPKPIRDPEVSNLPMTHAPCGFP